MCRLERLSRVLLSRFIFQKYQLDCELGMDGVSFVLQRMCTIVVNAMRTNTSTDLVHRNELKRYVDPIRETCSRRDFFMKVTRMRLDRSRQVSVIYIAYIVLSLLQGT